MGTSHDPTVNLPCGYCDERFDVSRTSIEFARDPFVCTGCKPITSHEAPTSVSSGGWIAVDLDGTIAKHYWPEDGPYDHTRVGDPVFPMVARVKAWIAKGEDVRIFTARVGPQKDGDEAAAAARAIGDWCLDHLGQRLPVTATKDYAMVSLWDDRAVQVEMNTGVVFSHTAAAVVDRFKSMRRIISTESKFEPLSLVYALEKMLDDAIAALDSWGDA